MSMRITIAICDDEKAEIEYLTGLIKKWSRERQIITGIWPFQNAESFLFHENGSRKFNILLLDIQMGALSGMELARQIRKANDTVPIIFITGYSDFMSEGYDVSALHYLMKPVKEEKLFEVLDKAVKRIAEPERVLIVNSDNRDYRIAWDDILYIEAFRNSVVIMTTGGPCEVRQNISRIEKELGDGFFRCQRSFIVMLKHIRTISKTDVLMDNGKIISLSRNIYNDLYRAFIDCFKSEREGT